jgi:Tol biopolymer transport system component
MNIDGTAPHPITHTTGSGIAKDGSEVKWSQQGSYSPDGTKITYSSTASGYAEIWVMNNDGSDKKQLTFPNDPYAPDANNPRWSPDGGKIVYFGGFAREGGYIFTINPDGSDRTQLTQVPGDNPSWSPDGQQIFFSGVGPDNKPNTWIMNRDGSNERPLFPTAVSPSQVPAITKIEAVIVPNDLNTVQKAGFDFRDITSLGSAIESPDISANRLNDSSTVGSSGEALAMDIELNKMSNDNGDVGGSGDGCW